jgi:hypothetical protein
MVEVRYLKVVVLPVALSLLIGTGSEAANTVDLSPAIHWVCDGDFIVHVGEKSGILRTIVKSRKIDESLPFYSCRSSHCDWGNGPGAGECQKFLVLRLPPAKNFNIYGSD